MKTMSIHRPVALFLLVLPLAGIPAASFVARRLWERAISHTVTIEMSETLLDVRMGLQDVVIPVLVLFTVLAAVNALLSIQKRDDTNVA
jgi:hypothetical protein